jgi:hypothetical protein
MEELLRLLLVANDPGHSSWGLSDQAWGILQEVKTSASWGKLAKAIEKAQRLTTGTKQTESSPAQNSGKTAKGAEQKTKRVKADAFPSVDSPHITGGLEFYRLNDGRTGAKKGTRSQCSKTYQGIIPLLEQVRTKVRNTHDITVKALKRAFAGSALMGMADDEDWAEWIDSLREGDAKNVALVFLERKTGWSRETVATYASKGKKERS